jgi:spore coat polysaccharide biosynthesis predicted glycosyltransferase SpsG
MGHTGRCVALGEAFTSLGWRVRLVAADATARRFARTRGLMTVSALRGRADLAIVDTYRGPRAAARKARSCARFVAAIDDLHQLDTTDVDLILRPSIGERSRSRVLGGATYVLLRREYRRRARRRTGASPLRVFVMLGAYPSDADIARVSSAVRAALPEARIDVASGVRKGRLRAAASRLAVADVAVVSGGQSLNEALAVGVPTIVITTFANQRRQVGAAVKAGAAVRAGALGSARLASRMGNALALVMRAPLRRRLVRSGTRLIDGRGALRAARALGALVAGEA